MLSWECDGALWVPRYLYIYQPAVDLPRATCMRGSHSAMYLPKSTPPQLNYILKFLFRSSIPKLN